MNILFIVIIAGAVVVLLTVLLSERNRPATPSEKTKPPAGSSNPKPVKKLSPDEARKWLDDFLVKQQEKGK